MDKYVLGSEKDFHDFVNSISKENKVGIVTHTDVDGLVSGVILNQILESKKLKIEFIEFLDHGPGVLKVILEKEFDVLFFTDWKVDDYSEDLEKLRERGRIFIIDHHPIDRKLKDKKGIIKTDYSYCSAHCLFDFAQKYFNTKNLERLTCAAIISDYVWDKAEKNFEFIKKTFPDVKKDASIWDSEPGRIDKLIKRALIYYSPNFKKIYDWVLKKDFEQLKKANEIIDKEVDECINKFKKKAEYFCEQKLYFYFMSLKYNITSTVTSILSNRNFRDENVIFASEFENKKGIIKVSARNQDGIIDLGKLLKKCIEGFEDSSGGGHIKAAACTFPKKYLNEFKKRLLKELKQKIC